MLAEHRRDMCQSSRGALIVIEGLDRAGKSTQHARLCQNLESQSHRVKRMRFPGAFLRFALHCNLD